MIYKTRILACIFLTSQNQVSPHAITWLVYLEDDFFPITSMERSWISAAELFSSECYLFPKSRMLKNFDELCYFNTTIHNYKINKTAVAKIQVHTVPSLRMNSVPKVCPSIECVCNELEPLCI